MASRLRGIQAADSGGSMIQHWRRCSGAATKPPCQWRGHILSISSDGGSCKAQPLAIRGGTNGWVRTDQSVRWTTRASARGAANRMADIHDAYLVEHVVAMFAAWFERQACQSVARSRRVNRARDIPSSRRMVSWAAELLRGAVQWQGGGSQGGWKDPHTSSSPAASGEPRGLGSRSRLQKQRHTTYAFV